MFTGAAALLGGTGTYVPAFEKLVEAPKRIVAATMALQKRGKSRWALTAPKPLAYLQLDNSYEHVLGWARKTYGKEAVKHLSYSSSDPRATNFQVEAKARWERFIQDYDYCVRTFKSVVVDTMTELYDLRRVAEFGRTTQIMQLFYGGIYSDFRWMVTHALRNDANVLFLHRMADEYIKNEKTGGFRLQGWAGIQFEAQMVIEHTRDEENAFSSIVRDSAQDAMLIGTELTDADEANDFPSLAVRVYPTTEKADWGGEDQ